MRMTTGFAWMFGGKRWAAAVAALVVLAGGLGQALAQKGGSEISALKKRVEQLEAQLVDIQVVLGTLETLARSGGGQAPVFSGSQGSGASDARVSALETQVRALSAQLQQLANQRPPTAQPQGGSSWGNTNSFQSANPPVDRSRQGGFGSTTVQPNTNPTIGGLIERDGRDEPSYGSTSRFGEDPRSEYEAAYGLLLQQDYGAAQAAFADFIKRHPNHALAGNAQYWLGETYYVQGQYKSAAGAFLTGYRKYRKSTKAPDSLLKLAMSLDRLGQRGAACSSLNELGERFPNAPRHVARRVGQEIRRLRC